MHSDTSGWMIDTVAFYRSLDFFREADAQPLPDLAKRLEEEYAEAWGDSIDPDSEMAEIELVSLDESRVWWEDLRAAWTPGDGTWDWVLKGWSRISRGAFRPRNIEEIWRQEASQVTLRFQWEDRMVEVYPRRWEGLLDLNVLYDFNLHLKGSGLRFEQVLPFDDTACLLALRADEKARLEARGWRFQ